jgi:hypothetical protein
VTQRSTARKWPSALPQNVMLKTASNAAAASINLRHARNECFGPRHQEIARRNGADERGRSGLLFYNTRYAPPKQRYRARLYVNWGLHTTLQTAACMVFA